MPILSYFPSGGGGEVTVTLPTVPSQDGELVYTGENQAPTWKDYDPEKLTIGGVTSSIDTGSYYAIFTPKSGYCWNDLSVEPRQVLWTIKKAEGRATASVLSVSLDTVSNKTSSFTVARLGDGTITAKSSNTSVATVSVSGSTVTVTSKGVGTAVITVSVAEGTNHTAAANIMVDVTCVNVWKKYSVSSQTEYDLYVPSKGVSLSVIKEECEDDEEYAADNCDTEHKYGTPYYAYYGSISVSSSGEIVLDSSVSYQSASYVKYVNNPDINYYVGGRDGTTLYLFELSVVPVDKPVKGNYIATVTSINPNTYPSNGVHTDGYWYVKQ